MKKSVSIFAISLIIGGSIAISSCKSSQKSSTANANVITTPDNPSYAVHIKPIIDGACGTKCHSASRKADGLDLSKYDGVVDACKNHKLLAAIKHESGAKAMPRMAPKLSEQSIATIEKWINLGFTQ
jgi:cytochrome c553